MSDSKTNINDSNVYENNNNELNNSKVDSELIDENKLNTQFSLIENSILKTSNHEGRKE